MDQHLTPEYYTAKIVVLGDTTVGKTSFIDCYTNGPREPDKPTLQLTQGPEFVNHKHNINNRLVKSSIWDTAGQERYRGINKTYYREAKGAILISDLSNVQDEKSFERWLVEFKEHADSNSQVIVVGNKLDLVAEKKTEEFLEKFSKKHGLQFFKMSAKTGENVQAVMMELIKLIDATYFKDPVMNFEYISRRSEYRSLKSRVSLSRNSLLHTDLNKEKGCCKSG